MSSPRIFLSGLGAVSAAGNGCTDTLDTFRTGISARPALPRFPSPVAKPVFTVSTPLPGDEHSEMRTLRLARLAVDEALTQAGLPTHAPPPDMIMGVCLGTTVACQLNDIDFYRDFRVTGQGTMTAVDRYLHGNAAAAIAARYGFTGPAATIVNACSSGTDAVGTACSWLRNGLCDAVIAGGADELNRVPLAGFNALGIMSPVPCAPFDKDRQGLNLGEGAGVVLLETGDSLARRNARATLTCEGYGTYGDAYHLTAPRQDGSGLEAAIRHALSDACCTPDQIGFINTHGTATATNDAVEGDVLARIFGSACLLSATKGYTGHTLGAAGGLEAVFTALGLREQWIPASAGFVHRDPRIPLAPVQRGTPLKTRYALSTSLAFGGNNSALILGVSP